MKNPVVIVIYLLCVCSLLYHNYALWAQVKNQAEIITTLKTDLGEAMKILRECDHQLNARIDLEQKFLHTLK